MYNEFGLKMHHRFWTWWCELSSSLQKLEGAWNLLDYTTKSNLKIGTNNDNLIVNTKRYDGSYMDRQYGLSSVLIVKVKKFKQVWVNTTTMTLLM